MRPVFAFTDDPISHNSFDSAWDDLVSLNTRSRPFQSSWWCKSWCQSIAESVGCTPFVAKAHHDGTQVACALALREKNGRVIANALGADWCDYYDAVGPDCPEATALLARLLEALARRYIIDLADIPPDGLLLRAASLLNIPTEKNTPCYIINLADSEWVDRVTSRRSRENNRRRLKRAGEVRVVNYGSASQIREHLPELISMHRAAWDGNPDTFAPFSEKMTRDLFHSMGEEGSAVGQIILSSLELDGSPLAMYFGLRSRDWYGVYRTAFNAAYKRFSPGHLLLSQLIQESARNGYAEFDLMRGAHPYKEEYASEVRWNHRLVLS